MQLRIAIWTAAGALVVGFLDPLYFRNVPSSTWDCEDADLSDLSHCTG
jgi:hypothetical protein